MTEEEGVGQEGWELRTGKVAVAAGPPNRPAPDVHAKLVRRCRVGGGEGSGALAALHGTALSRLNGI